MLKAVLKKLRRWNFANVNVDIKTKHSKLADEILSYRN